MEKNHLMKLSSNKNRFNLSFISLVVGITLSFSANATTLLDTLTGATGVFPDLTITGYTPAIVISPTATGIANEIQLSLSGEVTTNSFTLTESLYQFNGQGVALGTLLESETSTVNTTDLTTFPGLATGVTTFTGFSVNLVAGTQYYLELAQVGNNGDAILYWNDATNIAKTSYYEGGSTNPYCDGCVAGGIVLITGGSPVPVPNALWLFGSALVGYIGFNRRKTSQQ